MILDMIQGCQYLRRPTDRWLLSKNSTTWLKGLESWHGAGLLWHCLIPITNTKGSYLYPRLTRLLVDHDYNIYCLKLIPWCQCPSRTRHQFISFLILNLRHHAFPNAFLFQPWNNSPAEWWHTPDRRRLYRMLWGKPLAELCSSTKGPTGQSVPCTNFWC
jgi:hypothetical protein